MVSRPFSTGSVARRERVRIGVDSSHPEPSAGIPLHRTGNGDGEAPTRTPLQPAGTVTLILPAPPSANRWWRSGRGRTHLSHEAREYKLDVFQRVGVQGVALFPSESIRVTVAWHRDRAAGDLDKRLGVLLDALQSIKKRVKAPTPKQPKATKWVVVAPGVYDSDAQVVQLNATRHDSHPTIPKGYVHVTISAVLG